MLLSPLSLEFSWGEIPQRGVDPLVDVHGIRLTKRVFSTQPTWKPSPLGMAPHVGTEVRII